MPARTPGFLYKSVIWPHGEPTPPTGLFTHDNMRDGHLMGFADPAAVSPRHGPRPACPS